MELSLGPAHIVGSARLEIRHVQGNPGLIIQPASVLFPDPAGLLPVGGLHGIAPFLQHHDMALLLLKGLGRARMENTEPVPDHMQLRGPEQIAQMGVGVRVQDPNLLRRHKPRNGIRLPDVNGVLVIQIVGGDKVILSLPSADTGIRLVPGCGELVPVLMHPPLRLVFSRRIPVDFLIVPVHSFFHTASVAVPGQGLHLLKLCGRGDAHPLRRFVGNIDRREEPCSEPACQLPGNLQRVS